MIMGSADASVGGGGGGGGGSGSGGAATRRCFVACFVAPESAAALVALRPRGVRARWVPAERYHLTLRFLGPLAAEPIIRVRHLLDGLNGHPVTATVLRVTGFPSRARARVVVAELAEQAALTRWWEALAAALGAPDKPFRPHVTLGRSRRALRLPDAAPASPLAVALGAPALYESVPVRGGVEYRRLAAP
jgi:2'-5' RNA ligase